MSNELGKLLLSGKVPDSIIKDADKKIQALTARLEKLSSSLTKDPTLANAANTLAEMCKIGEERRKVMNDLLIEARKYAKKGGAGDEEK